MNNQTINISAKIEAIRAYTAAGFALIPLNGKRPTIKEWVNTPVGKYREKELIANYGVVLRAQDLVIDVDPRRYTPGDKPLARLVNAIGGLPKTYIVKTGGGGLHIYLRKPPTIEIAGSLKDYPGIEFKSKGHQVVGPGSIHPETGHVYEIWSGSPAVAGEAPL
jgi:hypothetical protein